MIKLVRPDCPNPAALAAKNYKHPDNKAALLNASGAKCMYCESKIRHIDFGDIEHIKPKAEGLFPELEFDWLNLGIACSKCNNQKKDKFDRAAPFIDPYSEDPEDHIMALGSYLAQRNGSVRGEITIREIDLNRPELLEKRLKRVDDLLTALNAANRTNVAILRQAALAQIEIEAGPAYEYSLIAKAVLKTNAR